MKRSEKDLVRRARYKDVAIRLVAAAREFKSARDDLRATAAQIAGCDLSDWPFETVTDYVDLAIAAMKERINQYGRTNQGR